ncbi:MAG TPA: DUF4337 family protein [Oculatellaceae cyanobacterium]
MEEGPEPQELMEHVEHNLHEGHGEGGEKHSGHGAKHLRSAVTAATLAVLAAIGSLLSGHAANDAILLQSKASDQWSYYQAKSTKSHLYENNKTLLDAFAQVVHPQGKAGEESTQAVLQEIASTAEKKMKGYEKDKKEIEEKAEDLEKESATQLAKHELYSFAVACFQIGIVIASVSILVDSGALFAFSIVGGVGGVLLLIMGYLH